MDFILYCVQFAVPLYPYYDLDDLIFPYYESNTDFLCGVVHYSVCSYCYGQAENPSHHRYCTGRCIGW